MTIGVYPSAHRVRVEHGLELARREACACGLVIVVSAFAPEAAIVAAVSAHQLNDRHRRWRARQEARDSL